MMRQGMPYIIDERDMPLCYSFLILVLNFTSGSDPGEERISFLSFSKSILITLLIMNLSGSRMVESHFAFYTF
jgi:hypothetical protein